ncbi:unnamed protein product [Dicrocoelium dendriticum]|nr:unnamed protein product [Dicrocoelium dendriticum]
MFAGLRGWSEEWVIRHPWDEVMHAVQNKYPNPHNNNVINIDVLQRSVDHASGRIHSLRLLNSLFPMFPQFGQLKAIELSSLDRTNKHMISISHNVDLRSVVKATEVVEYRVHPENKNWTLLKQSLSVDAFPLVALSAASACRQQARQGREALHWVIQHRLPFLRSCPRWQLDGMFGPELSQGALHESTTPSPFPTVANKDQLAVWSDNSQTASLGNFLEYGSGSLICKRSRFFADVPSISSSILPDSIATTADTSLSRLGSHYETITRDVTAMSDALLRRSQRVASLFSRIDEHVVIM